MYSSLGQEWRCHAQKQEAKPIYYSHPTHPVTHSRLLRVPSMHPDSDFLPFGGETKKLKSRQLCEIKQLFGVGKEHGRKRTVCHVAWTCTVRFVSSCPAIYNIWQQSGLTKSCLSFQNKRPDRWCSYIDTNSSISLHLMRKKSNYNRSLVNHIEKTLSSKNKNLKRPIVIHCIYVVV